MPWFRGSPPPAADAPPPLPSAPAKPPPAAAADGGGHPSKKKGRGPSLFANALAGGVSGMIATCVAGVFTSPLQRASTLLSIQDAHPSVRSGAVKPYANTFDCIARLQTEQGFYSLWRGFGARVAFSLPKRMIGRGVSFATNDHIKSLMPEVDKSTNFAGFVAVNIITGGLGGILPLSLLYPIDHALFRIQTDIGPGARAPASASLAGFFRTVSPRAWYTAFGASLPGIFIFRGVYFGVNDTLVAINPYQKKKDLTALASKFSVAQFASSSASFVGYPLGLVCARLKLQCDAPPAERLYRNALHCFNEIVAREGVRGLWKGFGASWMSQIGSAIALVTYGEVKALLFKKR